MLKDWIIRYAKNNPYRHIGEYMERYWIIPYRKEQILSWWRHPFKWLLQRLGVAIRVHVINRSDDNRALHDHPFSYVSWVLKGGYAEYTFLYDENGNWVGDTGKWIGEGSIIFRRKSHIHRLHIPDGQSATTLFITLGHSGIWGFYPTPSVYISHDKYIQEIKR